MIFLALAGLQLVPDGTILIHIALILLMIFILNRTFFRPINRIIELREKNKGGKFGAAGDILRQVDEKTAKFDAEMREARSEGYNLIESEREAALSTRQSRLETAKGEVEERLKIEKNNIAQQTADARTQIAAEAEVLAEKISSNILKS